MANDISEATTAGQDAKTPGKKTLVESASRLNALEMIADQDGKYGPPRRPEGSFLWQRYLGGQKEQNHRRHERP